MAYTVLDALQEVLGHDLPSMDRAMTRSLVDGEFRQRLLADAVAAFAEEGVNFPEGVTVTCHEVDFNDRHFFLPPMVTDPVPEELPEGYARPDGVPEDRPVRGGVRPGLARPFMLGSRYPAPRTDPDSPDQRW